MAANVGGGPDSLNESFDDLLLTTSETDTDDNVQQVSDVMSCEMAGHENKSRQNGVMLHPEEIHENRLCGWLIKLGAVGFVKTNKLLWFVYGDDNCKLYYYRNPQDLLPLGEIDISNAFFNFVANNTEKPGTFQIRSENKVHILDAQERHKMIFWLQELQKKRKLHSQKKTTLSSERVQWNVKKTKNISGLLGQHSPSQDRSSQNSDQLEGRSRAPSEPETSLQLPDGPIQSEEDKPYQSLNSFNLRREIRNAVSSIRSQFRSTGNVDKNSPPSSPVGGNVKDDWTLVESDVSTHMILESGYSQGEPLSPTSKTQGRLVNKLKNKFGKRTNSEGSVSLQRPSQGPTCIRCRHYHEEVVTMKEDLRQTEEELQANREIIRLLQKELDVMRAELDTRKEASGTDQQGMLEMLRQRDKHIVELEHGLAALLEDKSVLAQQTSSRVVTVKLQKTELENMKEQLNMYQDMLVAKDEVIMQLTNQVFELESNKGETQPTQQNNLNPVLSPSPQQPSFLVSNTKELERLRDFCQAYKLQNEFLTKEIVELNELRQLEEAREKMLIINFAKMEAEYYKTRSRYLILLKEIQMPIRGGDEEKSQEVVNQLLEEAMESETADEDNKQLYMYSASTQEYDRYGFLKMSFEDEEDVLLSKANILQKQSAELANRLKDADEATSHHVKWENFMVNQAGKTMSRSLELKILIRSGIPHEYREHIWKGCINMYVGAAKDKLGPKYYQSLVTAAKDNKSNPAAKQIELDLLRTLPNNKHFSSLDSSGIKKLRRILLAYSAKNPLIGYCQGLNRLAGIALLFLCEEEAFWGLVAIVEHLMPEDYFTKTLAGAQADQRVLKDLVQEKLSKLYAHFEAHDADLSLFTFNWFLTVFVDNIHPEVFLRIWDAFLYEGSKVLFRFAIAFLKYAEEEILEQKSSFAVNRYMRKVGENILDPKCIARIAFHDLNPFPMKSIASKRQFHLHQIREELAQLDAIRQEFQTHRIPDDRLDFCSDDDLDD